jgi:protein-S-isoprenylcysteine O-methyltransferase
VKPAQRLVRTGPYRLIRHPSYTGAFVALIASAILLHAWVTAVLGAIALYAAFRRRIRHEERLLAAALPGYRRYVSRTGALLPRWGFGPARAAAARRAGPRRD